MSEVVFETERLVARRLEPGDEVAMLEVYGDAEAMRWVGDGVPLTAEQCDRWLVVTAENYRLRGYGMFALVERASAKVVGFCGLVHPAGQAEAEAKYAFARGAWGRGLATEALRALLGYGSSAHGLQEIIATVAPDNAASQRVLLKAGMREGAPRAEDDGTRTLCFSWRPRPPAMSVEPVSYADFDDPPADLMGVVDDGLESYNRQAAPLDEVRPLATFAHGPDGKLVGGAVGRTWGECCELQQLWVASGHRERGIASRLLRQFEVRAAGRGCSVFYLTTLSFQAPDFYRRHGYASIAEIRGYPQDIAKYLMRKEAAARREQP
ncbi:MAG: GNAT family N-acetyltransferase [Burkholderiales bacterium]|nr:GNAT family N-acetyltransferase [Burkholderiales bacterium]